MPGNIGEDRGESPNPKMFVTGNGYMMLAALRVERRMWLPVWRLIS